MRLFHENREAAHDVWREVMFRAHDARVPMPKALCEWHAVLSWLTQIAAFEDLAARPVKLPRTWPGRLNTQRDRLWQKWVRDVEPLGLFQFVGVDGSVLPLRGDDAKAEASETCSTCRFYRPEGEDAGDCRRNAPQPLVGKSQEVYGDGGVSELTIAEAVWPMISACDWCGEWQSAPRREGSG